MATNYLKGEPLELRWRSSWCEHQARTIPSLFQSQAETLGDSTLYLVKREGTYQPVSWQTVRRDVETLAAALIARGVQPGDRVAILSENRYEWVVADLAILHAGAISVTLHFPLTPTQVEEQLRDSESVAIFVSNATQAQKVEQVRERLPALKHFFSFEPLSGWVALGELQEEGRRLLREKPRLVDETAESLNWDSLATIIYTSGTTGESKGVMLSHGNLLASVYAAMRVFPPPDRNYVMLNFLPLSHIYARTCDYLASMALGVELAFAESIDTLREDLQAIRPHAINGVPRFYEKVRERVLEVTQSKPLLRLLGKFARKKGLQRAFGGRLIWAISGGAAKPRPTRMPASENDFERVRSTSTLSCWRTRRRALSAAKSTYASSTTSSPATWPARAAIASTGTKVPDGALGLQTIVTRAPAAARPSGKV